jgi:hypothetical protein
MLVTFRSSAAEAGRGQSASGDLASGALNGQRYRVFISTDIGGGDDYDYQSPVHYFVYGDLFDMEGIISSPPKEGTVKNNTESHQSLRRGLSEAIEVLDQVSCARMLSGDHEVRDQGDPDRRHGGENQRLGPKSERGSEVAVECALRRDLKQRPLYVLLWGCATDLAYALSARPEIKKNIRVVYLL